MVRRKPRRKPLGTIWEISDELWRRIEPILLEFWPKKPTGRKVANWLKISECDHLPVVQRLPVGPTARAVRPQVALSTTCSYRWAAAVIFELICAVLRRRSADELGGVQWEWQPADAMLGKARFGLKRARIPPTRKKGTKKSMVTDGDGWHRWGWSIAAANVLERRLLAATSRVSCPAPEPQR